MSAKGAKSLFSILDEFALKNNERMPFYTITSRENACTKVCSVTYCKETVTGRGPSKKKAKLAAAKALMFLLCSKSDSVRLQLLPIDETTDVEKRNPALANNFIGQLFEYCTKYMLPPPKFDVQKLDSSIFQAECTVGNVYELVSGATKKQAKQLVAKVALELLQLKRSNRSGDAQLGVSSKSNPLPDWGQISVDDLLRFCAESQLPAPSFKVVGPISTKTKSVKCTINNVERLGTSLTKTGARLAAARVMYQTIRLAQNTGNVDSLFGETPTKLGQSRETISVEDHVSRLYMYCENAKLPRPSFEVIDYTWNSYGYSKYRVECTVGDVKVMAAGRKKKEAKKAAAKKMLDKVRPIDKNETMEIADDAIAPLRDDDIGSDNSEQSTQPDDLQVDENETKEITEKAVVPLQIDGINLNDSEQSTQLDDLQVTENEMKEIAEEAVLLSRDGGIGSNDNQQLTQSDDFETEEAVLPIRNDSTGTDDKEQSTQNNDPQDDEILEIIENVLLTFRNDSH
ncbi:hypothetical protein HA402_013671 [Bradysia odoriphaga]|nr:hypothetical protein HA402_013671 [Bradysia odoriphaga]